MLSRIVKSTRKLLDIGKKIILILIVYLIVLNVSFHFMQKDKMEITQIDTVGQDKTEIYKIINDKKLQKTTEGNIQIAFVRIMGCALIGEGCTKNPVDAEKNFPKSIFGMTTRLIAAPYERPPASGIAWVNNGLQNAGIVPKTYAAAGLGFASISPLSPIWIALRNVAYLVLALVMITIGFMIMFRAKINPQTTISVENALPKIVIALLMITFSFPIAGFLIDLMYVSIALILSVIGQPLTTHFYSGKPDALNVNELQQYYMAAGPWQLFESLSPTRRFLFWDILFDLPNALLNVIPAIGDTIRYIGTFIGIFFISKNILDIFTSIVGFFTALLPEVQANVVLAGANIALFRVAEKLSNPVLMILSFVVAAFIGVTFIVPLLIGLIIFLTVLLVFFRIFFLLIGAYIKLLVYITISPVYLLFEAIPGQSTFSSWIKNLLGQLVVFPVVIALLQMSALVARSAASGQLGQLPFLVGIEGKSFGFILGMFFMFMIPDFVKLAQQLFVPKPGALDSIGVGTLFGGATTGLSTGLTEVSKYAGFGYYVPRLGKLIETASGGLVKMPSGGHAPGH